MSEITLPVLEEKVRGLTELVESQFDAHTELLKDIKEQTTKTNGSVAAVKTDMAKQKGFSDAVKLVGGIMIPVLIGCIGYLFVSYVSLQGAVKSNTAMIKNLQDNLSDSLQAAVASGISEGIKSLNK